MDSFYIFLIVAILAGAFIGYLAGFIRIVFLFVKIAAASSTAYFLTSTVAEILSNNITAIAEWAQAFAFAAVFVLSFVLLHLLFLSLVRKTGKFNKTILNKTGGAFTGLAATAVAVLFFIQVTDLISVPQNIEDEIKLHGIADVIKQPVEMVNDKFVPIFQPQPVQVMALEAAGSIPETGIILSYVADDFEIRRDLETEMLNLVNAERNRHGLKSLIADAQLAAAAKAHSADMFTRGYFSHNTPEGINPFQRLHKLNISYLYAGENLAMAPTLLKAHEGLMKSPGHRANILNPSYGRIGIGILDASVHGLMITQEFRN